MNLHEYQAKEVFAAYGIPVPAGRVAATPEEAVAAAQSLGGAIWVVKAQVHAGGRGKAGGVKLARDMNAVRDAAKGMLGTRLATKQTGPEGLPVEKVYVESGSAIDREIYLSLTLNREKGRIAMVGSAAGGMDIEEVAEHSPEKITKVDIHPAAGLQPYQCRRMAFALGFKGAQIGEFQRIAMALYDLVMQKDAGLVEVNPLIVTKDNRVLPLDCKMSLDDNALYRQKSLAELMDMSQIDAKEALAHETGINYIALNGNIGCMVNGAGLAMATMDLIKLSGGEPANFLDVGGGATAETVAKAFKIILADANVKAVLVNIFGGIMRCDIIAEGIIVAVKEVGVQIPVIVRLEGTNVDLGKQKLKDSGLAIITADDLNDAAQQAVRSVK